MISGAGVPEHSRATAGVNGGQGPLALYAKDGRCDSQGVTIRGEGIKAHAKKKRDANSRNEEELRDDDGGHGMRP